MISPFGDVAKRRRRLNPDLVSWIPTPQLILEFERKLITRYRTGSHSLNIEVMRYSGTKRSDRLCLCKLGVQTIWHIFMDCPLTIGTVQRDKYKNLQDIFSDPLVHTYLGIIIKKLKIPIGRMLFIAIFHYGTGNIAQFLQSFDELKVY